MAEVAARAFQGTPDGPNRIRRRDRRPLVVRAVESRPQPGLRAWPMVTQIREHSTCSHSSSRARLDER